METTKIDWALAPVWANAVIVAPSGQEYFVEGWNCFSAKRQEVGKDTLDEGAADSEAEGHVWVLVELRPVIAVGIKSLEERIKDRAIAALAGDVEEAMRHLCNLAQGAEHQPSGVGELTIREVIDAAGAAVMKARSPVVADNALNRALERLADHVDPGRLYMISGVSPK